MRYGASGIIEVIGDAIGPASQAGQRTLQFKDGSHGMTTTTSLDIAEFTRRELEIDAALKGVVARRVTGDEQPLPTLLKDVFVSLFGEPRTSRDRMQFLLFAAPRMRRFTIDATRAGRTTGTVNLSAMDLEQWLSRLEGFDPECAQMIDLRYFAGLSTRETAAALGLSPQAVIRDLRFAKAWLQARIRWVGPTENRNVE